MVRAVNGAVNDACCEWCVPCMVRGAVSDAVRLELRWRAEESAVARVARPSSVFYKRVVMGELDSSRAKALAAPFKLARDAQSFGVEARRASHARPPVVRCCAGTEPCGRTALLSCPQRAALAALAAACSSVHMHSHRPTYYLFTYCAGRLTHYLLTRLT